MTRMDFTRRADLSERMDAPACDARAFGRTLDLFRYVNRAFSRYVSLLGRHVLRDMLRDPERPYCLADLGAGGCDVARWLALRARRLRLRLRILAVDCNPRVLAYARRANRGFPEIEAREGDALGFPFREGVDYAFSNHLLHHLDEGKVIRLLARLDAAGLRRYVMSDIARSRRAWIGFGMAVAPFANGSFHLEDGLASVRRSFTLQEMGALVRQARLRHPARVLSLFPSRLAVVGGRCALQ